MDTRIWNNYESKNSFRRYIVALKRELAELEDVDISNIYGTDCRIFLHKRIRFIRARLQQYRGVEDYFAPIADRVQFSDNGAFWYKMRRRGPEPAETRF